MNTLLNGHFISPTRGEVSVDGMVSSISEFVKEDPRYGDAIEKQNIPAKSFKLNLYIPL